jgi:hypothetical protein
LVAQLRTAITQLPEPLWRWDFSHSTVITTGSQLTPEQTTNRCPFKSVITWTFWSSQTSSWKFCQDL